MLIFIFVDLHKEQPQTPELFYFTQKFFRYCFFTVTVVI